MYPMNRRRFMSLLGLGVAGIALEQAIPLGRVWSFPKEIVITNYQEALALTGRIPIGSTIRIRFPQRYLVGDGLRYTPIPAALQADFPTSS